MIYRCNPNGIQQLFRWCRARPISMLFVTDKPHQIAASRRMWPVGQRQRCHSRTETHPLINHLYNLVLHSPQAVVVGSGDRAFG